MISISIPPFEKASEKAPALMKNNQSTDRNNEEVKRKIAVPSSKTGKSVVYIPPTVEDAGESDGGYQEDQAYDDIKDDDRDVESFNGSTKDAPAQQRKSPRMLEAYTRRKLHKMSRIQSLT